jgi:hypothetical protein
MLKGETLVGVAEGADYSGRCAGVNARGSNLRDQAGCAGFSASSTAAIS